MSLLSNPSVMVEKEMPRIQLGMVDGCFEEGHYERGIAILNDLRVQDIRPAKAHVRQLIYLALYPPSTQKLDLDLRSSQTSSGPHGSPSKRRGEQELNRLAQKSFIPKPEITLVAQKLLHEFSLGKISPEALMRAVPCYPLSEKESSDAPRTIPKDMTSGAQSFSYTEDEDSFLSNKTEEALHACRDCWDLLRPNVVQRLTVADDDADETDDFSSSCIGRHSWFLLEYFVRLFEKDQALGGRPEAGSSLLLSQIKPVESTDGISRPNADTVVEIMFDCYAQGSTQRKRLGKRLLLLLLSLTNAECFGSKQLLTSITTRLRLATESTSLTLLSDLPDSRRGRAFRLALCDRYIHATMAQGGSGSRPVPRAKAVMRRNHDEGTPAPQPRKQDFPWETLSSQRILHILEQTAQSSLKTETLNGLFYMVLDFGTLKTMEKADRSPVDETWLNAVATGELQSKVSRAFRLSEKAQDGFDRQGMMLALNAKCEQWKNDLK